MFSTGHGSSTNYCSIDWFASLSSSDNDSPVVTSVLSILLQLPDFNSKYKPSLVETHCKGKRIRKKEVIVILNAIYLETEWVGRLN